MGNIYSYFAADDDAEAVEHFDGYCIPDPFGTTGLKGADPFFLLATVEAELTGTAEERVDADPRFCALLSSPEDEGRWLVSLTDSLREALAAATPADLLATATAWTRTEDGAGTDPEGTADFLGRLASLARSAVDTGQHLYCAMSL